MKTQAECILWEQSFQHIMWFRASQLAQWWRIHLPLQVPQKTRVLSLHREDPPEKEMATYSSILAEIIPWSEEPNGLQSMGLQSQTWPSIHAQEKEGKCKHLSFSFWELEEKCFLIFSAQSRLLQKFCDTTQFSGVPNATLKEMISCIQLLLG